MYDPESAVPVIDVLYPEVSFQIEGETYRLRFDMEAISLFQIGTGINLVADKFEFSALVALLWAGLNRFHSGISIETVESWVNVKSAQAFFLLILKALKESLPDAEPKQDGEEVADPATLDPQSA